MRKNKLNARILSLATGASRAPLPIPKKPPVAKKDRATREEAYKIGVLDCLNGKRIPCVLLDISEGGARIRLHCASSLPNRVRVAIPSTGFGRDAEVRWQSGAESGLCFLS